MKKVAVMSSKNINLDVIRLIIAAAGGTMLLNPSVLVSSPINSNATITAAKTSSRRPHCGAHIASGVTCNSI